MGVSFTCKGGGKRTHNFDLRGLCLKDVAELSKSWNFEETSLGVAALNTWYARPELLDPLGLATMSQSSCPTARKGSSSNNPTFPLCASSPLLASTAANCSHNDNRGSTTKGQ